MVTGCSPFQQMRQEQALVLRAKYPFNDKGTERQIGEEYLFKGPGTYIPRIEEEIVKTITQCVVKPNSALVLRAKHEFTDRTGVKRQAGEEWLMREVGAYLPSCEEDIRDRRAQKILRDDFAIHLRALNAFTDAYNRKRQPGDEWLVTKEFSESHIIDVNE